MRINTTPESDLIPFRDTLIGDVFAHKGTICIKIEKINTHITENAVALLYGYTITFQDNDQVCLYREAVLHLGSPAKE